MTEEMTTFSLELEALLASKDEGEVTGEKIKGRIFTITKTKDLVESGLYIGGEKNHSTGFSITDETSGRITASTSRTDKLRNSVLFHVKRIIKEAALEAHSD